MGDPLSRLTPPPEDKVDEKTTPESTPKKSVVAEPAPAPATPASGWPRLLEFIGKVAVFGRVEIRGITPIPVKERTETRTINIFTLWWSINTNILP